MHSLTLPYEMVVPHMGSWIWHTMQKTSTWALKRQKLLLPPKLYVHIIFIRTIVFTHLFSIYIISITTSEVVKPIWMWWFYQTGTRSWIQCVQFKMFLKHLKRENYPFHKIPMFLIMVPLSSAILCYVYIVSIKCSNECVLISPSIWGDDLSWI